MPMLESDASDSGTDQLDIESLSSVVFSKYYDILTSRTDMMTLFVLLNHARLDFWPDHRSCLWRCSGFLAVAGIRLHQ